MLISSNIIDKLVRISFLSSEYLPHHTDEMHKYENNLLNGLHSIEKNQLNEAGFVVVKSTTEVFNRATLFKLQTDLGSFITNHESSTDGVFTIQVEDGGRITAKKSVGQMLHTDNGLLEKVPKYVSLLCIRKAEYGGYSLLVDSTKMANFFYSRYGEKIYTDSLVHYYSKKAIYSKKVFDLDEQGGINTMFLPFCHHIETNSSFAGYLYLKVRKYLANPANHIIFKLHPNEILIFDNHSMIHSRTEFNPESKRQLLRLWYSG
jgi:hypothetical protein